MLISALIGAGLGDDAHADFEYSGQMLLGGVSRLDVELINESLQELSAVCSDISH